MPTKSVDATITPFDQYILEQFELYKKESFRLKSKVPLLNFQDLLQSLQIVEGKLGSLEHEVALDALQKGFKGFFSEVQSAIGQSWRNFWRYRQQAAALAKQEEVARVEAASQQQQIRKTISELEKEGDDPLIHDMRKSFEELAQLESINIEFSGAWHSMSWTGLWVDSKIFALYIQYIRARFRVFLQFHAFIFLLPILVFGIGYSLASKALISSIATISPGWFWVGPVALIASYAAKKYLIDKKIKNLQKRVETRLYKPLAKRLFLARNTALAIKTLRTGRRELSDEAYIDTSRATPPSE